MYRQLAANRCTTPRYTIAVMGRQSAERAGGRGGRAILAVVIMQARRTVPCQSCPEGPGDK